MSLIVKDLTVVNLKGKHEKLLKISFRGITHSYCAKILDNEAVFGNEACTIFKTEQKKFTWDLSSAVSEHDFLDFHLFNRNKVFNDRLIGTLRFDLKNNNGFTSLPTVENVVDDHGNILEIQLNFIVKYHEPEVESYIPLHVNSVELVDANYLTSLTISQQNLLDYEGNSYVSNESIDTINFGSINLRARFTKLNTSHQKEWQKEKHSKEESLQEVAQYRVRLEKDNVSEVRVDVFEGNLFGEAFDPVVDILIGNKKQSTSIKQQNNKPVWNESFVFEFVQNKERFLETTFQLKVYSGRNVTKKGDLIGHVEFDLWTIYEQPMHRFVKKWAVLQEAGTFNINGHILMTIRVIGEGDKLYFDPMPSLPNALPGDLELLLPEGTQEPRDIYKYSVTVYKAESIPPASTSVLGSVKKVLGGKHIEMMDTYVEVTFGNTKLRTSVVKGKSNPEFNEVLSFKDFFPPMFKHFKIQLRDSNAIADEVIATHFIDVNHVTFSFDDFSIENSSVSSYDDQEPGLVPTFGPSWVHLYGSSRDFDKWASINEGFSEGNSYRGKLLLAISCSNSTKEDMKDTTKVYKATDTVFEAEKHRFLLYANIFDVSLIDRSLAEKPVMFEISMVSTCREPATLNSSKQSLSDSCCRENTYNSFTKIYHPKILPNRKFCYLKIGPEKPSLHYSFFDQDNTFRDYQATMLQKTLYFFEDKVLEMKERNNLNSFHIEKVTFRKTMGILQNLFQNILDAINAFVDSDCQCTLLDRRLMTWRMAKIKHLHKKSHHAFDNCNDMTSLIDACTNFKAEISALIIEPQHSFPDVIIWMICGGKRLAFARIAAKDVLYSDQELECGLNCGVLQTIFFHSPMYQNTDQKLIQAKMEIRIWLGHYPTLENKEIYLANAPGGYTLHSSSSEFPVSLVYENLSKYTLRAHLYQARNVLGSDESGLSDPFARVLFGHYLDKTRVINQTRTPLWDQMFMFKDVTLYGDIEHIMRRPPVILLDVFDQDEGGEEEFLGRTVAIPTCIKSGLYIPPKLQIFPIMIGDEEIGEVVSAFELYPSDATNIPPDPSFKTKHDYTYYPIPDAIRPHMKTYRVEMLFWGVREMKRLHALKVTKPQIIADFNYEVTFVSDSTKHRKVRSKICNNALQNPNFPDQVVLFDVDLPVEEYFLPTFTLKVYEHRRFGRTTLVGTHTSEFLKNFFCTNLGQICREKKVFSSTSIGLSGHINNNNITSDRRKRNEKNNGRLENDKINDKKCTLDDDTLDWWARYYASVNDAADPMGYNRVQTNDEKRIIRVIIYKNELEKEFNNFNDFLTSFPIHHGKYNKHIGGMEDERSKRGKIKGAVRIWKKSLLCNANMLLTDVYGSFQNLPSNEPIKILVRVYCVAAKHLNQKDFNGKYLLEQNQPLMRNITLIERHGKLIVKPSLTNSNSSPRKRFQKDSGTVSKKNRKIKKFKGFNPLSVVTLNNGSLTVFVLVVADPFLVIKLGAKKFSDSENHASNTLQPEFGRLCEFEGELPFDNLLTVQIYDWDLLPGSNELIGETKIDIENRFYSKHRATCGLAHNFTASGYVAWRDGDKPTTILNELCENTGRGKPRYHDNYCCINEYHPAEKDGAPCKGENKLQEKDEIKALEALHSFQNLPNGYALVPEHLETRTLYNPQGPSLPQGEVIMWVDIFPIEHMVVPPPVDITRRKPKEYELRVIVWNCMDVPLLENSIILGSSSSDIYVRSWLEGLHDEKQKTDVHYRSTDGTGMFNWRFKFPFNYHVAKKQFVYQKKLSAFSLEETEQFFPTILTLQCMESDVITADEVIGVLKIPLLKLPLYYGKPTGWTIQHYLQRAEKMKDHPSLFKCKSVRGWWPFSKGEKMEEKGRVELELELVTKEEADANPVGIRREEPHALEKPHRPEENLRLFIGPIKTFQLLFSQFKWEAVKTFVIFMLAMLLLLFFYSLPGYMAKKSLSV